MSLLAKCKTAGSLSQTDSCKFQGQGTLIPKLFNEKSEKPQCRVNANGEGGKNGAYQWEVDQ